MFAPLSEMEAAAAADRLICLGSNGGSREGGRQTGIVCDELIISEMSALMKISHIHELTSFSSAEHTGSGEVGEGCGGEGAPRIPSQTISRHSSPPLTNSQCCFPLLNVDVCSLSSDFIFSSAFGSCPSPADVLPIQKRQNTKERL